MPRVWPFGDRRRLFSRNISDKAFIVISPKRTFLDCVGLPFFAARGPVTGRWYEFGRFVVLHAHRNGGSVLQGQASWRTISGFGMAWPFGGTLYVQWRS